MSEIWNLTCEGEWQNSLIIKIIWVVVQTRSVPITWWPEKERERQTAPFSGIIFFFPFLCPRECLLSIAFSQQLVFKMRWQQRWQHCGLVVIVVTVLGGGGGEEKGASDEAVAAQTCRTHHPPGFFFSPWCMSGALLAGLGKERRWACHMQGTPFSPPPQTLHTATNKTNVSIWGALSKKQTLIKHKLIVQHFLGTQKHCSSKSTTSSMLLRCRKTAHMQPSAITTCPTNLCPPETSSKIGCRQPWLG